MANAGNSENLASIPFLPPGFMLANLRLSHVPTRASRAAEEKPQALSAFTRGGIERGEDSVG
jgi:hypothetical protein